ncbi:MAG: hypothetical protein KME22_11885 [Hassallia sp. WJT32-NPBG1]|nr:hypothetical protein [Hassallia sp. WJT32-NPBG1]
MKLLAGARLLLQLWGIRGMAARLRGNKHFLSGSEVIPESREHLVFNILWKITLEPVDYLGAGKLIKSGLEN